MAKFAVSALLFLIAQTTLAYNATDIVIRPNSLNRRGVIGPGRLCPKGSVAEGFRMKMEPYRALDDNSALNAVRLICSGTETEAKSTEGHRGEWTEVAKCRKDDFISAVKIKSEHWLGWDRDDLGALDLEAECSSGVRLRHRRRPGWITARRGVWSDEARCPPEAPAVCGLKVRLDEPGRRGGLFEREPDLKSDSAGLTEVQFKCCEP